MLSLITKRVQSADTDLQCLMYCLCCSRNSLLVKNLVSAGIVPKLVSIILNNDDLKMVLTSISILDNLLTFRFENNEMNLDLITDVIPKLIDLLETPNFKEALSLLGSMMRIYLLSYEYLFGDLKDRFLCSISRLVHPSQNPEILLELAHIIFWLTDVSEHKSRVFLPAVNVLCAYQESPQLIRICCDIIINYGDDFMNTMFTCDQWNDSLISKYMVLCRKKRKHSQLVLNNWTRELKIQFPDPLCDTVYEYYTFWYEYSTLKRLKKYSNPLANIILSMGSPFCSTNKKVIKCINNILINMSSVHIRRLQEDYNFFDWLYINFLAQVSHDHNLTEIRWTITHLLISFKETPLEIVNTRLFESLLEVIKLHNTCDSFECVSMIMNAVFVGHADSYNPILLEHEIVIHLVEIMKNAKKLRRQRTMCLGNILEMIHSIVLLNKNDFMFKGQCQKIELKAELMNIQSVYGKCGSIDYFTQAILNELVY